MLAEEQFFHPVLIPIIPVWTLYEVLNSAAALDCVATLKLFVLPCVTLQCFVQGLQKMGNLSSLERMC